MISRRRLLVLISFAAVVCVILVSAVGVVMYQASHQTATTTKTDNFKVALPTTVGPSLAVANQIIGGNLIVTGEVSTQALILSPTTSAPKTGQLYASTDGSLRYYNGTSNLNISTMTDAVSTMAAIIQPGTGLTLQNGHMSNSGVLSMQGQSGNVSLVGGDGIAINGTTVTNSGVTSLGGQNGNVVIGDGLAITNGKLQATSAPLPQDLYVTSSPTFSSLTLSSALPVASGGTGTSSLLQNGVLIGQGTAGVIGVLASETGQCLVSTVGAPTFQVCPGTGGVTSVNGSTGAITINGTAVGSVWSSSGVLTFNDATASVKGLAAFNGNNFTVQNGVVDTIQGISVSATPTFNGLNLTNALSIASGGTGATTASQARNNLDVAVRGVNNDITQLTGLTAINPNSALAIGSATQDLTLQGAATTLSSQSGGNTTTLSFVTPTANVTYSLQSAAAGTYDVCTTVGNCVGIGGGVTSAGGTVGRIAKFTTTGAIGDSLISDNGTTVTIDGPLVVNNLTSTSAATIGSTTQSLTLQGAVTNLTSTAAGVTNTLTFATPSGTAKTIIIPNASGTVAVSATGPLSLGSDGNLTCPSCLTTDGSGGHAGVVSVNGQSGTITIAAITPSSILTSGGTITIQDASSTVKGLASFNSNNLIVTNGAVDTIQGISVSATPTFNGLNLTSALGVSSGGTGLGSTPMAGQLLIGNGSGYSLTTLTAGSGVAISNSAGGITISSPTAGTCPTCANQSLNNLTSVALNTSLLPGTSNSIDLGSNSFNFRNGYLAGSLQVGSLDAASAAVLSIGTTNATAINLNQNTTIVANKSLTVAGGITSTRPASPTAGMVYYDTTTNELIKYNGTKWVSDRSTSTKIVAASNSSQANKDAADYIATGTGDQATINTALTAASGGLVYLMEGTYNETAAISIPNNTTLAGAGAGTLITIPNAQNGTYNLITNTDTTTGTHVTIRDLRIDGNKANQTSGSMTGIYLYGMGAGTGSTARDGAKLINLTVRSLLGSGSNGIYLNSSFNNTITGNAVQGSGCGIYLYSSQNNTITGNAVQGNSSNGIYINFSSSNTITGNTTQGSSNGIYLNYSSSNTITGNTVQGNSYGIYLNYSSSNTITGNTAQGNSSYGIYLSSSSSNTITGNTVQGNYWGIYLSSSSSNTITGNTVQGNNWGIYLSYSSNNNVTANKIHDNGGATTNNGIFLQSATGNSITSNDITDTSCTSTCYAINITDAGSTTNYLANNHHVGTVANPSTINDVGTGTVYANQSDSSGNLLNESQGGGLTVGASAATASLTLQGSLVATALPIPAAAILNVSGTAGTTTYGYRVSALDGRGETLASTETTIATGNATLSATNKINITWLPVGGAVQYKIYRSTSGGTPATTGLISTVAGNMVTIGDTGLAASGSLSATNTTGGASFAGTLQGTGATFSGALSVTGATNLGQLTVAGASLFKNTVDSTTALQVQNSVSSALLVADTTNMTVTIAKLVVNTDITVNGHIITGGTTPTILAGAAACTTPTVAITGTDTAGTVTVTTGTACAATGVMATVTFNSAYGVAPRITLTPRNTASVTVGGFNGAVSATNFTLDGATIPTNTTTYTFNYMVMQ